MDGLVERYQSLVNQVADLFPERETSAQFLRELKAVREEWDVAGTCGRVYFDESREPTHVDLIRLIAHDSDGAIIEITLDVIGWQTNWAEWRRTDGRPVQQWPPPAVLPQSRIRSRRPGMPSD